MYKKNADVGILTWHYYKNIGSNLQAYAMQTAIQNLGYSSAFINYRGEKEDSPIKFIFREMFSLLGKYVPGIIPENIRAEAYRFQQDKLYMTDPFYGRKDLSFITDKFRIFICGSDQIWAPNVLNDVYLFSFLKDENRRYSYAASIGLDDIPKSLYEIYNRYLHKFRYITVREKQGCDLLKKKFAINAERVLDPTFLVDANFWLRLAKFPKKREKFIFCYFLGNNTEHREWVKNLQKHTGLHVVCLTDDRNEEKFNWEYHYRIGPERFLGYVQTSEFIVTDSFHGVALSINLGKPFYVVERFASGDILNQNSRIYDILELLGLEEQLIYCQPNTVPEVNYGKAFQTLANERNRCLKVLKSMLAGS